MDRERRDLCVPPFLLQPTRHAQPLPSFQVFSSGSNLLPSAGPGCSGGASAAAVQQTPSGARIGGAIRPPRSSARAVYRAALLLGDEITGEHAALRREAARR